MTYICVGGEGDNRSCMSDKMSDLTNDFKVLIINVFQEQKKTMFKELKQAMIMPHQIEYISKDRKEKLFKRIKRKFWS